MKPDALLKTGCTCGGLLKEYGYHYHEIVLENSIFNVKALLCPGKNISG